MVMGDLVREVDVAVVGGGPGGYSAGFRCADLGLEAVVVDAGKRLGGACLYEGGVPAGALLLGGGLAVFEDSRSLRVEGDEPQKIRFKHAVIATGSLPSPLPGVTARSERGMDSTAAPPRPPPRRSEDLFEKIRLSTEVTVLRDSCPAIEAPLGSETGTFDRV